MWSVSDRGSMLLPIPPSLRHWFNPHHYSVINNFSVTSHMEYILYSLCFFQKDKRIYNRKKIYKTTRLDFLAISVYYLNPSRTFLRPDMHLILYWKRKLNHILLSKATFPIFKIKPFQIPTTEIENKSRELIYYINHISIIFHN